MKEWIELYRQHGYIRSEGRKAVTEIRQVLKSYGEPATTSIFANGIASRLQQHGNRKTGRLEYRFEATDGEHLDLCNHPGWESTDHLKIQFEEARLTIYVVVDPGDYIQEINLMLKAYTRRNGQPIAIAVHLPDNRATDRSDGDRQGVGACGHAAMHCHIGPSLEVEPKLRIPFPALRPARVLEWMLSQIVPALEAAPWPEVRSVLKLPPWPPEA